MINISGALVGASIAHLISYNHLILKEANLYPYLGCCGLGAAIGIIITNSSIESYKGDNLPIQDFPLKDRIKDYPKTDEDIIEDLEKQIKSNEELIKEIKDRTKDKKD